jgi:hypothetical protein
MTAPQMLPPEDVQRVVAPARRTAYHPDSVVARALMWPLWPVLDQHTGRPSSPKCMAAFIAVATATGHPIGATVSTLLLATMFGYSMFKAQLDKTTLGLTGTDSVALAVKHEHTIADTNATSHTVTEIVERRSADQGFEASP